ncbi:acylphosphatase [Allopusillimonas ginsengisoli]|uniref:acylphosphatase n=1 Tax=Allopusillimonas ginsengisoli TaxID=453575 RepID=UPI001021A82F|nr:acylphosphatase [Allopusillimonas ginsengisoli]TEA72276.1 acylphosphatase [Allopusillimonas ginsengisoli]
MKKLSNDHNIETIVARVSGHVQGVGFRAATVRQAHLLSVRGWVRNLDDGAVEVLMQATPDRVDRLLSWLHTGPPAARVREVTHEVSHTERRHDRFEQI